MVRGAPGVLKPVVRAVAVPADDARAAWPAAAWRRRRHGDEQGDDDEDDVRDDGDHEERREELRCVHWSG